MPSNDEDMIDLSMDEKPATERPLDGSESQSLSTSGAEIPDSLKRQGDDSLNVQNNPKKFRSNASNGVEVMVIVDEPSPDCGNKATDDIATKAALQSDSVPNSNLAPKQLSMQPSSNNKPTSGKEHSTVHIAPSKSTVNTFQLVEKYGGDLSLIPAVPLLPKLTDNQMYFLEEVLQIDKSSQTEGWQKDWSGNLNLLDKEIALKSEKNPSDDAKTMTFLDLIMEDAANRGDAELTGFRGVYLLMSYICNLQDTPPSAKKIMAYSILRPSRNVEERYDFLMEAKKRVGYDPQVLREDGWTTTKSESPEGSSGGAYLIGEKVIWEKYEAIIIGYLYDHEGIGDLWKLIYIDDQVPFDLEADEIQEGFRRYNRREERRKQKQREDAGPTLTKTGPRYSRNKYTVEGIEYGIVLAMSSNSNARRGVKWPARVMSMSEVEEMGTTASKRTHSKNSIAIVFLAPYWNGANAKKGKASSATASNPYSSGPLFQFEYVEAMPECIQKYSHDKLSMEELRAEFRFSGLPQPAFARFINSHRIAVSLKQYAMKHLPPATMNGDNPDAFASLTDSHLMTIRTASFPSALLHLPYEYILQHLPSPLEKTMVESDEEECEPILDLPSILEAMKPPACFGNKALAPAQDATGSISLPASPMIRAPESNTDIMAPSPSPRTIFGRYKEGDLTMEKLASADLLRTLKDEAKKTPAGPMGLLESALSGLQAHVLSESPEGVRFTERKERLDTILRHCLLVKAQGEDALSMTKLAMNKVMNKTQLLRDWRKICERFYKLAGAKFSTGGFGRGVTAVLTDLRCNGHITANDSFERTVRLPAAIKGAKLAGAGSLNVPLVCKVKESYIELVEKSILSKAHNASYLRKMKSKIAAIPADVTGFPLTDDSDEDTGGEDTKGSRGSFTAALTGVGAAIQAVDMVVGGQCANAFCAVRPPGHHAGKELRAMNAISNGFCILNSAACAAIFAVTPVSEGGRGLKRVVVIDFDVHHGNGTQDILCSTHDSRFLYVSVHAGGAHLNGYEDSDDSDTDEYSRRSLGGNKDGIFPGKCGDTSPHPGVLNIPLGKKVTALGIGTALMTQVKPAVEEFAPDLMILSAGFDAHVNDPLGMGGLSAADFGTITEVACTIAERSCSGRVVSLLEGGYGVPCCREPKQDLFLPESEKGPNPDAGLYPDWKALDLGEDLPATMNDNIPMGMIQVLDKCHSEGFLDCVKEHVSALKSSSSKGKA
eukprot:CAMPEP_0116032126 /NCGR_PEP_ID=MMETSP0321-20121206/17979_1 /TAXON_ID=163516 /ORGANISM="Leptocylindrus danicus var. danicus, Strain B650" /LENGTH=1226 /DNA_ID=CAMNT_0003507493 /DNA_START=238 /DNA_END=3918 /DNA_ORIENTATION=+